MIITTNHSCSTQGHEGRAAVVNGKCAECIEARIAALEAFVNKVAESQYIKWHGAKSLDVLAEEARALLEESEWSE